MSEHILIPLDGSTFGEAALHYVEKMMAKLSPNDKPEITLLHVISPHFKHINVEGGVVDILNNTDNIEQNKQRFTDYLNKAAETLKKQKVKVNCQLIYNERGASSAEEIIEAEEKFKADLVAMSTHGRRGITRWSYGSVTDKVLRSGKVPVLMVRAKAMD